MSNNAQWSKEDIKSLYLEHVLPTLTIKMPKTLKPRYRSSELRDTMPVHVAPFS
jgi:hypothetical protein